MEEYNSGVRTLRDAARYVEEVLGSRRYVDLIAVPWDRTDGYRLSWQIDRNSTISICYTTSINTRHPCCVLLGILDIGRRMGSYCSFLRHYHILLHLINISFTNLFFFLLLVLLEFKSTVPLLIRRAVETPEIYLNKILWL